MSGSPIIQDGKLVGAVPHVLMNDPTKGYGIFIETMLDAAARKACTHFRVHAFSVQFQEDLV